MMVLLSNSQHLCIFTFTFTDALYANAPSKDTNTLKLRQKYCIANHLFWFKCVINIHVGVYWRGWTWGMWGTCEGCLKIQEMFIPQPGAWWVRLSHSCSWRAWSMMRYSMCCARLVIRLWSVDGGWFVLALYANIRVLKQLDIDCFLFSCKDMSKKNQQSYEKAKVCVRGGAFFLYFIIKSNIRHQCCLVHSNLYKLLIRSGCET